MATTNKINDRFLKAIYGKPYEGQSVISDGSGLSARISKNGAIGWIYRYRLGGRETNPKLLGLGSYPETSLKQAREKRDRCREWLDNGKDPGVEMNLLRASRQYPVTVKEALDYWLKHYAKENRKNYKRHQAQFERHIYPTLGRYPLADVSTSLWCSCFDKVRRGSGKRKAAPVAAGYIFQNCKQALIFCRKRGFALSHALDDLIISDVGKKQAKRDRVLSDEELTQLLELIQGDKVLPYYQRLILLLVIFGARTQEVRLSTWDEWDFHQQLWTVPKANSKNSEMIIRPIPDAIIPWLLELKFETQKTGFVLGGEKSPESVSQYCRILWKKLDHQESWSIHDLRRTIATKLNDLGVAPHVVDHLLGHTVAGVSGIYNRSQYLSEKSEALRIWVDYLGFGEDVSLGRYEGLV
ncbi:Putative prophage CPS-53 integrase [Vibrio aerogenes CECT 7868]|uniref:Putative prophage CPS-53 integrase n=1 Tax=Vibrio aerogenes CECT 7868 TaxID=1216006 RepID=A0A1M5ZBR7_9VIBR|nr:site-specific integrase [Vibrio aerogenes]SHI21632.1 Putative prophage CPS-53 integrase [Vibrio aerogenes CECT 7868]